jgi:hypothetical protein
MSGSDVIRKRAITKLKMYKIDVPLGNIGMTNKRTYTNLKLIDHGVLLK